MFPVLQLFCVQILHPAKVIFPIRVGVNCPIHVLVRLACCIFLDFHVFVTFSVSAPNCAVVFMTVNMQCTSFSFVS